MDVTTIQSDVRYKAREKYLEYMRAVRERHTEEDEALKKAYRQLSLGNRVLDINQVMRETGVDARGRPKLAICRAHAKLCWFYLANGNQPRFSEKGSFADRYETRNRRHFIDISRASFQLTDNQRNWFQSHSVRAVVPTIPPSLRPAGKLDRFHVLWEAEWETIPIDPMLLRHLGKSLYVVVAEWDLTELERAVLSDRL